MRGTELYRLLRGLQAPWTVERVALDESARRVDVWVVHPDHQKFACPQCSNLLAVYDHTAERVARGYPNREQFRAAIFFHCGKLDMYPEY